MTNLPFMMMNWGRFFTDPKVDMLDTEAQGIYALLLGRMWLNQGWLSADDKVISRTLRLDIRRWKSVYKPVIAPLLRREIDPDVGPIYTQKHLQQVRDASLAISEKNVARTAKARAAMAAKRGHRSSVTEPKRAPATKPVTEPVTDLSTVIGTKGKEQPQQKELSSALQAESLVPSSTSTVTALPPRDGAAGKLDLGGRLPTMPVEPVEAERSDITKRLVEDGLKPKRGGLLASLDMGKR